VDSIDTISYSVSADIFKMAGVVVRIHKDISIEGTDIELNYHLFVITKTVILLHSMETSENRALISRRSDLRVAS
jgi:hypothetical protein